ncbi:MAG: hypothetical protein WBG30_05430 [Psychrilyobacter sp.]|uniref:hypothetical protein n=1 Tax=Psychrilyobacter sp. TaxID=2586924 RepID=UPI003C70F27D
MNEIKSSNYYVDKNPQDNGDHEVHREDCKKLPNPASREYLGNFDCCEDAVEKAKEIFSQSIECFYCSKE